MVHVLPHWTWSGLEGKCIPVMVYSNCDEVELFQDDESLGKKQMDRDAMVLRWDVEYKPGSIKRLANKAGNAVIIGFHFLSFWGLY